MRAPPLAPTAATPTATMTSDAPATAYMLRETPRHERLPTTFEWWVCCDCGGASSAAVVAGAQSALRWNMAFTLLGIVSLLYTLITSDSGLRIDDWFSLVDIAVSLPLLAALMEALPREDTARLQTLQRWTKAVCGLYALAVVFDVVVAIFDSRRAVEWLGGAGTDLGSLSTWANVAYFVRHVLELLRAREAAPLKPVERWLPRI